MSKDTINPKRWILDEQQIGIIKSWAVQKYIVQDKHSPEYAKEWLQNNPCPLPNPVEIPSDEEICEYFNKCTKENYMFRTAWMNGFKFLRDLIFNKQ